MVENIFGETQLTLKELIDLCQYGTSVRVENAYNGHKFISYATKPYVNKKSIEKSKVDKKFENTPYVKYGNMPINNIHPYISSSPGTITSSTYVLSLQIEVSAHAFDIDKAKKGEYALSDEQKQEFYGKK